MSQSSSESGILTETACGETESPMLTPCKSHQTVSLVGNSDIHPCLCIQDPEDAHDANCDFGERIWRAYAAPWCNLEITTMTMTTLTEQIALQEASWNHVTPLERLCQKFFAILTRPHLRRHHLHITTIFPFLCHPHQGCISCGILVSGIRARGVSSEHMENMEMFSCSPT